MKYAPIIAIPKQAVASTINSNPIPLQDVMEISAQAVAVGGAVAGTVKIQVSNDNPLSGTGQVPVNWSDLSGATVTVSAAGPFLIPKTEVCYQWAQVVYTDSGTGGTIAVNVKTIGF